MPPRRSAGYQAVGLGSSRSSSTTSKTYPSGSRKKNRRNGVLRIGSMRVAPRAMSRSWSEGNSARGKATAMCRPNSFSNGEGSNSGSSTRCSSTPGAIVSQAAGRPMLPGRAIGGQPSASAKNAHDRRTSRVASVMCASAMIPLEGLGVRGEGRGRGGQGSPGRTPPAKKPLPSSPFLRALSDCGLARNTPIIAGECESRSSRPSRWRRPWGDLEEDPVRSSLRRSGSWRAW